MLLLLAGAVFAQKEWSQRSRRGQFAEEGRAKSCKATLLFLNIYSAPAADANLYPAHTDSRVPSRDVAHVRWELCNSKHAVRPEQDE